MSAWGVGPPPLTYLLLEGAARGFRGLERALGPRGAQPWPQDTMQGTHTMVGRLLALAGIKLVSSPLCLQTTLNNDAEHSETHRCSLPSVVASSNNNNNNCCYSHFLQHCCRLAEGGTLFCQTTGGCQGPFYHQSGIPLCSWPQHSARGEQKYLIISCD